MSGLWHRLKTFGAGGAIALALAAPLKAETAFDAAAEATPCLAASTEVADFRAAFAAEGWAEPAGPARTPALHALGEIRYIILRLPKLVSPKEWTRFIERSHAEGEEDRDFNLVMTRDGLSVGIEIIKITADSYAIGCYMSGTEIPGVAQAMTRPEAKLPNPEKPSFAAIGLYSEEPELSGYAELRYDWILIDPPFTADPPPLAAHSILVAYKFDPTNPPVPPLAPKP